MLLAESEAWEACCPRVVNDLILRGEAKLVNGSYLEGSHASEGWPITRMGNDFSPVVLVQSAGIPLQMRMLPSILFLGCATPAAKREVIG